MTPSPDDVWIYSAGHLQLARTGNSVECLTSHRPLTKTYKQRFLASPTECSPAGSHSVGLARKRRLHGLRLWAKRRLFQFRPSPLLPNSPPLPLIQAPTCLFSLPPSPYSLSSLSPCPTPPCSPPLVPCPLSSSQAFTPPIKISPAVPRGLRKRGLTWDLCRTSTHQIADSDSDPREALDQPGEVAGETRSILVVSEDATSETAPSLIPFHSETSN